MDKDKLPDRWENIVRLDPTDQSDAKADYDNDGLDNSREFFLGTHPFNPDTDGGGQSDGSEYITRQDPLFDRDDKIPTVINYGVIWENTDVPFQQPQPQTNIIRFPADPAFNYMQIWKSSKPNPNWSDFKRIARVDLSVKPRGIYYDENLVTGKNYYYYLVAEGATKEVLTAPTSYFIGTPP